MIYVSGESNSLINGLKANITSGKATLEQLNSGSQQIISSVDGNALAGAAYTAAKGLFSELIIPTVSRVTAAIDDLETELQTYRSSHDIVSGEGKLDEDKLNQQIATKKAMKIAVDSSIAVAKSLAKSNPASNVLDSLLNVQSRLGSMSNEYADNIRELEEKLEKLRQFSSSTSGLFNTSLAAMKLAMQSVMVLSNTLVKSDGTYVLPFGTDKSWFENLMGDSDVTKKEKALMDEAIKEFNDLYSKNPMAAIEKVKNNKKLFEYIITILDSDKLPKEVQNVVLDIFIAQESWNKLPKDLASKILNNPKFALYMSDKPLEVHASVYGSLIKLNDKGWNVLAPLGHVTNVLSKSSAGEALIAGTKIGFNKFKKLDKVTEFISKHKVATEAASLVGDGLTITSLAYKEYINPNSPAYGDPSKAMYGGSSLFLYTAGPLEGAQYGGPVGAVAGTINTIIQGNITIWPDEIFGFDLPGGEIKTPGFGSEKAKEKWLNEQYEKYGKHDSVPSDKNYKPGIPPHSGSGNFNPGTQYVPNG